METETVSTRIDTEVQPSSSELADWSNAAVYQIYPRTFRDGNGDGIGDFVGIMERLDYIRDLGCDAIWLCPMYPSPGKDGGYDVKDYTDVADDFGTMEEFRQLVDAAHERGIKVMLDIIPNHTSNEHEWFEASRDQEHPDHETYRDFYYWSDRCDPDDPPPNNWASIFSEEMRNKREQGELEGLSDDDDTPYTSAWEYDEVRGAYYLRTFGSFQPDLDWRNSAVQEAMKDVVRFWLDLGVGGLRIDAVKFMGKHPDLEDDSINQDYRDGFLYEDGASNPYDRLVHDNSAGHKEAMYDYLRKLAEVLDEPGNEQVVYDLESFVGLEQLIEMSSIHERMSVFNFTRMSDPGTSLHDGGAWDAEIQQQLIDDYNAAIAELPEPQRGSNVQSNHDVERPVSRLDDEQFARALALINAFLPGRIYVYQGEELGLTNASVPDDRVRDAVFAGGEGSGRDVVRAPIPIEDSENGGFSDAPDAGETQYWLPFDSDHRVINAEAQAQDPNSFLSLYRELLRTRRELTVLREGEYLRLQDRPGEGVVSYGRTHEGELAVVIANLLDREVNVTVPEAALGRVAMSSAASLELGGQDGEGSHVEETGVMVLQPGEAQLVLAGARASEGGPPSDSISSSG